MAFVWTTVSPGKKEVATHVNEAQDNVNTLADNLSVSHYGWTQMPAISDEEVGQPQIQELQDATDYIDSVNICSSENAGYDISEDTGDDSTVNSTADSSIDNSEDVSVDLSQNTAVDSGQNTGIDSSDDTAIDNNQHGVYYGVRYSSNDAAKDATALEYHDSGVFFGEGG